MEKSAWLVVASGLATGVLLQPACERTPAERGSYEWIGGGEAGAPDSGAASNRGGTGGAAGKAMGHAGDGPDATGGTRGGGSGAAAGGGSSVSGAPSGGAETRGGAPGEGGAAGEQSGDAGSSGVIPDPCDGAPDTDDDGVADPCDDDDDDDGHTDSEDPAPGDPTSPGGLAAPGTIVLDACVRDVLAELESLDMTMPIHRGRFPPEMNGYYVRRSGTIVAANDGVAVGASLYGMEARVTHASANRFHAAWIEFWGAQPVSHGIGHEGLIRGQGSDFTHYGASAAMIVMYSASLDAAGSWLGGRYLSILLPTSGMPHAECPPGAGLYRLSHAPLISKVNAEELEFMCVDGNDAYVPTESWTRGDGARAQGERCECTTDYQVSCIDP